MEPGRIVTKSELSIFSHQRMISAGLYHVARDYQAAIVNYELAIEALEGKSNSIDNLAHCYMNLADCQLKLNLDSQATVTVGRLSDIMPHDHFTKMYATLLQAKILERRGEIDVAIKLLEEAIQHQPHKFLRAKLRKLQRKSEYQKGDKKSKQQLPRWAWYVGGGALLATTAIIAAKVMG